MEVIASDFFLILEKLTINYVKGQAELLALQRLDETCTQLQKQVNDCNQIVLSMA
jgi:DNA-binding Xre family transcriptional regulator